MRSSRFAPAFALILAAGLATGAAAQPQTAPEKTDQTTSETAKQPQQPAEKMPVAPSPDSMTRPVPVAAESQQTEQQEQASMKVTQHAQSATAANNSFENENEAEEFVPTRPFNNPLAAFDKDGNGWLTAKERKAARQGLRMSRMALMTTIDANGDRSISDAEWADFSADFGEGDDDWFLRQREIFRDFDGNFDGGLSRRELKKAERELQERRLDFAMQFDENSDGELSEFELAVATNFVERRREWFFAHWDTDEDGTLNEIERRNSIAVFASASNQ
jgi:hypothetical protein